MKKKSLALVLALAMIVVCVVGGTLAWLTATTPEVKNTFTYGDINIELEETGATVAADGSATKEFKMIPGYTIAKDPKVTVLAGSEKCYLFVKVDKSANFDTFMTYTIADGWTALDGVNGVYYREVAASTDNQEFGVLKDDQVTVKGEVTKAMMNELTTATYPTLTFTAPRPASARRLHMTAMPFSPPTRAKTLPFLRTSAAISCRRPWRLTTFTSS